MSTLSNARKARFYWLLWTFALCGVQYSVTTAPAFTFAAAALDLRSGCNVWEHSVPARSFASAFGTPACASLRLRFNDIFQAFDFGVKFRIGHILNRIARRFKYGLRGPAFGPV